MDLGIRGNLRGIRPLRWGSQRELARPDGLVVGRSRKGLLRVKLPGHFLTFAPSHAGKCVSSIVPNLLMHSGSAVVVDPGGEHYRATARVRKAMGQRIHAIDPFGIAADPVDRSSLNPCDSLDSLGRREAFLADDAAMVADLLVVPGTPKEAYWNLEAAALLAGLIAHVVSQRVPGNDRRTLGEVRRLLTNCLSWEETLEGMSCSPVEVVRRAGARMLQKGHAERTSVTSTAQAHTHFLDSDLVAASLATTTSDLDWQASGRTTIYLILPPERISTHARWLRVLVGGIVQALSVRQCDRFEPDVLLLLDDAAAFGSFDLLQRFHAVAAMHGVKIWLFFDSLSQMRVSCGRHWRSLLVNSDMIQAFGVSDAETARMLSGRARSILRPSDVLGIDPNHQLLLRRGCDPVVVGRCRYYLDREFAGLFDLVSRCREYWWMESDWR